MAAQNCHWQESGAYTGEISAPMVAELGCEFVILGHSERRHIFHESDEMIARKIAPVMAHGMRAILCVGETLEERRQKLTGRVIARQLRSALKGSTKDVIDKLEIAYEPVWAIGTGQNATHGASPRSSRSNSAIPENILRQSGKRTSSDSLWRQR